MKEENELKKYLHCKLLTDKISKRAVVFITSEAELVSTLCQLKKIRERETERGDSYTPCQIKIAQTHDQIITNSKWNPSLKYKKQERTKNLPSKD